MNTGRVEAWAKGALAGGPNTLFLHGTATGCVALCGSSVYSSSSRRTTWLATEETTTNLSAVQGREVGRWRRADVLQLRLSPAYLWTPAGTAISGTAVAKQRIPATPADSPGLTPLELHLLNSRPAPLLPVDSRFTGAPTVDGDELERNLSPVSITLVLLISGEASLVLLLPALFHRTLRQRSFPPLALLQCAPASVDTCLPHSPRLSLAA